jgi:AGZA family xanthine/uracil permease-like MFS transporter
LNSDFSFFSIFFAPIFASIPPWATGSTLILVGSMMIKAAADINWAYPGDAIPAFVCIIIMPFTYSIAYGLIAGIITYIVLNTTAWAIDKISGGRIVPHAREISDPWTWRIEGGILPLWVQRLFKGKKDFWKEDESMSTISAPQTPPSEKFEGGVTPMEMDGDSMGKKERVS